jgi:Flp pilus assembly protein TadG
MIGRFRSDDGAVSIMIAVLSAALLISVMLVVDGGRQLAAVSEARDLADNAARFGAQAIDLETWRDTGRPVIDAAAADAAVADFFANYVTPGRAVGTRVPSTGPDADITVTVEVQIAPTFLFFPDRTVTVTESANALDGVAGP